MSTEDTIAAIATPRGSGGIGIIRVSGEKAEEICHLLFKPLKDTAFFQTHHLYHGTVISSHTGEPIDEVLISLMRNPHSYTGEDTLEINCHGGPLILETVLGEVIRAGARPAEPGEFTKRAFLNGRIDLSQAEAVIDIISAKTERGINLALSHMRGELSEKVDTIRESLIEIIVFLETAIDFTDDDIEVTASSEICDRIKKVTEDMKKILSTYGEGKLCRDGLKVLITGKPNVGKSSLLNRLLGEKRAIVTSIPGTTRDFIEESININGIPVHFIDTAGIRDVDDAIEKEGVGLVWEKAVSADLIVVLLDGSSPLSGEDHQVIEGNRGRKIVLVINKSDLPAQLGEVALKALAPDITPLWISAKYGRGIDELKEKIYALAFDNYAEFDSDIVLTNLRHKLALEKAVEILEQAGASVKKGLSPELSAFDIREALDCLGEIVGITTNEDVLDEIFSKFCIGK
ncbi:MAG: tRNA uridine-5-carboxymethylaminomethyl(34) synthesis GTPase MnmE [Deltaproteobacteria bacterium]|nr:tRNA uridine-5-carboxymethylaminomethyl(34) synthesis GTPase MnmE [Deltaproteobacteria bacterium]